MYLDNRRQGVQQRPFFVSKSNVKLHLMVYLQQTKTADCSRARAQKCVLTYLCVGRNLSLLLRHGEIKSLEKRTTKIGVMHE